ncbi:MAG: sulfate adenylyltransferase [Gemmatimonadetes bacterium]|nr:sulfate adenylyltransferase [Gemmatimonadota bacterium]
MSGRIQPHGGLDVPVNRAVPEGDREAFVARVSQLTKVAVSDADLSSVYRFGDGALSPLEGPMDSATYNRVLEESVIEYNGSLYSWTIPISFPVDSETAVGLKAGEEVALVNSADEIVGSLELSDVFPWDKETYLRSVYLTDRTDHPGGDMVLEGDKGATHLIGGRVNVLPQATHPAFGDYVKSPAAVRELLAVKGWDRVVAFQTRNPLHRAHEYALVYGLEKLLKDGANAGAVLNPLIGETKSDDVSAEIRMHTYEALIEARALGEGDSDGALWSGLGESVPDRVLLLGLDIKMFYGGPKEAVMHGIYRQNYGFTDIVIGRKHADAPYHDGSAIWGDFDAQAIFNDLKGDLKIKPVNVGFAAFYESLGRVDLMENHDGEDPVFISGKKVRELLQNGEQVDPRIMRESTSAILSEAMSGALAAG